MLNPENSKLKYLVTFTKINVLMPSVTVNMQIHGCISKLELCDDHSHKMQYEECANS